MARRRFLRDLVTLLVLSCAGTCSLPAPPEPDSIIVRNSTPRPLYRLEVIAVDAGGRAGDTSAPGIQSGGAVRVFVQKRKG